MSVKNILIVGVGGQGTLLASKLLGAAFVEQGYDVKVSEVHGMSQRGGSVVTYVRYGDKVHSSLIEKGEADIVLSFEQLEPPGGCPISSQEGADYQFPAHRPHARHHGQGGLPGEHSAGHCRQRGADKGGGRQGAGSRGGKRQGGQCGAAGPDRRYLGLDKAIWMDILRATVPPKTVAINEKAFELGYAAKEMTF